MPEQNHASHLNVVYVIRGITSIKLNPCSLTSPETSFDVVCVYTEASYIRDQKKVLIIHSLVITEFLYVHCARPKSLQLSQCGFSVQRNPIKENWEYVNMAC